MKKTIFLLAIMFAAVTVFAQNNPNVSPERPMPSNPPLMFMPAPNCQPPVAVYVTQNNNSFPLPGIAQATVPMQKPPVKYIYRDRGSVTFITNHNYFGDTATIKDDKKPGANLPPPADNSESGSQPIDWRPLIWSLSLGLLAVIITLLADWYRGKHPVTTDTKESASAVSEYPKPVKPAVDLSDVHEKLKDSGDKLTVFPDGRVELQTYRAEEKNTK